MLSMDMKKEQQIERDRALIGELGGPAKVASILNFDRSSGVQRVCNWKNRGIPASIKVQHPEIFLQAASK